MGHAARPRLAPDAGLASGPWGALEAFASLGGIWLARSGFADPRALAAGRLRDLVAFARERSPFYQRLYAGLPADAGLARLPRVDKRTLMASFDDWATDRAVRRATLAPYLEGAPDAGAPYLGRYLAWKSSGTSGTPGWFVQDAPALGVYDALVAAQLDARAWPALWRLAAGGGRAVLVAPTGGRFASVVMWDYMARLHPQVETRALDVMEPLPRLAAALAQWKPAFLSAYPSMLTLLASEQEAGRLALAPALLWSGGEDLSGAARARIERAFGCPVMDEYGASECLGIAHGCREGWQHLNEEWVALEPVEADGSPTPRGRQSHTALLTNLANRVQPVIRYDIGDRILAHPGRCACGNPAFAFRVAGRCGEPLALRTPRGRILRVAPLALETAAERDAGGYRVQVACEGRGALAIRLDGHDAGLPRALAARRVAGAVREWLATQGGAGIRVAVRAGAPRLHPRSGKLSRVLA